MIEIIPNFHPIFVHFSVAIIVLVGLLQLLKWVVSGTENINTLLKWFSIIGSVAVILTIASGLYAASTINHDSVSHLAMLDHRSWAIPTALVFLAATAIFLFVSSRGQSIAGPLFIVAFILVGITAFKGGELVYRFGLGVLSLPTVTADGHDHEHAESTDHSMEIQTETSEYFSGLDNDAAKTVIAFHDALNSGNAQLARKLLNDAVLIFEGGGVERSADEYADHHMKSDVAFLSKMQITVLEQQVSGNEDMAVSMSRSKLQGNYKGKDINIESMETIILRKHDDNWLITHIHWSN